MQSWKSFTCSRNLTKFAEVFTSLWRHGEHVSFIKLLFFELRKRTTIYEAHTYNFVYFIYTEIYPGRVKFVWNTQLTNQKAERKSFVQSEAQTILHHHGIRGYTPRWKDAGFLSWMQKVVEVEEIPWFALLEWTVDDLSMTEKTKILE